MLQRERERERERERRFFKWRERTSERRNIGKRMKRYPSRERMGRNRLLETQNTERERQIERKQKTERGRNRSVEMQKE